MLNRNSIIFSYLNLNIKVISNRIDHIAWLKEFLYPQFDIAESDVIDYEIAFIEHDGAHYALQQNPPLLRKEIIGFKLDNKTDKLLIWRIEKHWQILFDENLNVFYFLSNYRNQIRIIFTSGSGFAVRMALMKVIREYAMNYEHPEAGYFIHASAFDFHDTGIMIAGPKNSGKTSLLMYFLLHLSSRFISNDRVFLYFDNFIPIAKGMPTVVTIPQTSYDIFSKAGVNLPIKKYHHWYTLTESIDRQQFFKKTKEADYTITPYQFCKLIGVETCCKINLSAVVFPIILETFNGIQINRIDKKKAIKWFKEVRFAKNIIHTKSIFNFSTDVAKSIKQRVGFDEFIQKCVSTLSCFECLIGYNAYEENNTEKLISQILSK